MSEDRFDELMRDAARTYRNPTEPDFDAMWTNIERRHFGAEGRERGTANHRSFRFLTSRWVGIAATLVVGIGIGRASITLGGSDSAVGAAAARVAVNQESPARTDTSLGRPYEVETSRYLGQTAALLVSLPSEVRNGANPEFALRAADLLSRTRLLIDSPAAADPAMRGLLEDLELVLMQVVRLQGSNGGVDLDLINRALEQRDVIPRLRTAAAENSAN